MSTDGEKDWKRQALDSLEAFADSICSIDPQLMGMLLEDEGQENLTRDLLKGMMPTMQWKRGDALTALELGRMLGHWEILWASLMNLREFAEDAFEKAAKAREAINSAVAEIAPEIEITPATGFFHALAEINDPRHIDSIRDNQKGFHQLVGEIKGLALRQTASEQEAFRKGYGEAHAVGSLAPDGTPIANDKQANLLAMVRPFAMLAGFSVTDLQLLVDEVLGGEGDSERLQQHLYRRKAAIRGKGRPAKKSASVARKRPRKSDKS